MGHLSYPATTAYKQWVWRQIRARNKTLQWLVDEIRAADRTLPSTISTSTLSDLLGPEDSVPEPSNTKLMPAINKVLGLPPPPVCRPEDHLDVLVERFRERWERATPRERAMLAAVLAADDD